MLAVGGRRTAGVAVEVMLVFELGLDDDVVPEDGAADAVQTKQLAVAEVLALRDAGGEKNTVAPDDGRRMADAGNRRLPTNVLLWTPDVGDAGFAGSAVAAGRAARPLFRLD